MRARNMRRRLAAVALGATALAGGSAAASDYPPNDPPVTTRRGRGWRFWFYNHNHSSTAELPKTGGESNATMKVAGGAIVAGAGMLVAARLRRRPTA